MKKQTSKNSTKEYSNRTFLKSIINILSLSFKISRFRFWTYIAGTYLVGYTIAASSLNDFNLIFFLHLIFFTTVANVLLYGINDYFDYETDILNSKKNSKDSKEYLAKLGERKILLSIVIVSMLISLMITGYNFYLGNKLVGISMLAFLFLSVFYSAPPLRFKDKPVLDFSSNFLYILPGIVGYFQLSNNLDNYVVIIGLFFWTSAMQLYSAVPDIIPDKKAKINTTAVVIGHNYALILCTIFWSIFSLVIFYTNANIIIKVLSLVYPLLSIITLIMNEKHIHRIYWLYPYINSALGFVLFIIYFLIIL